MHSVLCSSILIQIFRFLHDFLSHCQQTYRQTTSFFNIKCTEDLQSKINYSKINLKFKFKGCANVINIMATVCTVAYTFIADSRILNIAKFQFLLHEIEKKKINLFENYSFIHSIFTTTIKHIFKHNLIYIYRERDRYKQ